LAESNEFIREVDEEYRRDRIAEIWKRYNGLIVGLAVLIVAAVGGWRYWQHLERNRAEAAAARYQEALRLDQEGKGEEAAQVLRALTADSAAGYRLLARFRLAAETGQRDALEGAKAYDALSADGGVAPVLQDLARLRGAMLRLDTTEAAAAQPALERLATPTNAWRHTAREMLGLAALKKGDYDGAGRWFDQIAADRETPQSLRSRLEIYSAIVSAGPAQATQ
jgi:hypothetical protein